MKTIALSAAVLLLSHSFAIAASSDCAHLGQWGQRGVTADIAVDGSQVWVADGRGVAVYDVSNPELARQLVTARTATPSRSISLTTSRAVILTSAGIETFARGADGSLQPGVGIDEAGIQAVTSNDTFIAAAGMQLELLVPGADNLTVAAVAPLSGVVQSLLFDGDLLLAGIAGQGIFIYDTSGGSLSLVGQAPVEAMAMIASGSLVYAVGGGTGVSVVDVTNPQLPVVVTRLLSGEGNLTAITRSGSTLYVTDRAASRIDVISITDPRAPTLTGTFDEPSQALRAANGYLYSSGLISFPNRSTSSSGSPLRIFSLSDPLHPVLTGEFLDYAGPLTGAATDGSYAYVADPPLFRVIDIRNPASPREVASLPMYDSADRIYLSGTRLLVYGRANVHIIDVSDPVRPRELGVYLSQGNVPDDAAFAGQYLVEDNRASGFHVVDITDPSHPTFLSGLKNDPQNGQFFGLVAVDGAAYGFTPNSLKVIDLSNPRANRLDHVIPALRIVDAAIAPATDTHAQILLLIDAERVRLFDLADIIHPAEIADLDLPHLVDIDAEASVAYGVTREGELVRIDISDPHHPFITDTESGLTNPVQVSVSGDRVVVADSYALEIYRDLHNAAAPIPQPITLSLISTTAHAATVEWTAVPGASYEVEISPDPEFTQPETVTTTSNRAALTVSPSSSVRVRATNGCATSDWSNTVTIPGGETSSTGLLAFSETGRTIVVGANESSVTISVPVSNISSVPATATLVAPSDSGGISPGPSVTIQPGQTQSIDVTLDPSSLRSSSFALGLAGFPGEYQLHVLSAHPTTVEAPSRGEHDVLAGVASTPGAKGTIWKSDLNLLCRSTSTCEMTVSYHAYGSGNASTAFDLSLGGGESVVIEDVVRRIFDRTSSVGAVHIQSTQPNSVLASATTYNDGPAGRSGQRIVAAHVRVPSFLDCQNCSQASLQGIHTRRLLGVVQDDKFRTNIGLVNTSDIPQSVSLQAVDTEGTVIGAASRELGPGEGIQISFADYFPGLPAFHGGSVVVSTDDAVVAYVSRVDQKTGDGTYSLAAVAQPSDDFNTLPLYVRQLAVATSSPGAQGTLWKTALQVVNEGDSIDNFTLTFIPSADPSQAIVQHATLASHAALNTDDLLGEALPSPYGTLRVASSSPFTGWARVYNDSPGGTYGQYVPLSNVSPARAVPGSATVSPYSKTGFADVINAQQIFPVSDNARERTNFGIAEVSGKPAGVTLKVFDPAGNFLGATSRSIGAFGSQPLFNVLNDLGLSGVSGLRVEVEQNGEGLVTAYASVVERATGDAVYIPAE